MLRFLQFLKFTKSSSIRYSSLFCDLYYIHTRNFFLASFILSFTKQLFGEIIICNRASSAYTTTLHSTYCLINGTFTYMDSTKKELYFHDYYQWISIVLLFEALAFSIPHIIWKTYIGRKIENLTLTDLKLDEKYCNFVISQLDQPDCNFLKFHIIYELCNLINVKFQFILLHLLLNRDFYPGFFYLPSERLFPIFVSCRFEPHEFTDSSVYKDFCLLPLNILYKNLFLIIWIWFHIIFILHCIVLFKRLLFANIVYLRKIFGPFYQDPDKWFFYQIVKHNIRGENSDYIKNKLKCM